MKNNPKKSAMNWSLKAIVIIIITLILFRIFLHYTEMGFFEFIFFELIPKWFLFLLPICFLGYKIRSKDYLKNSVLYFSITTIGFYLLYYRFTPDYFDKVDWRFNYTKREKIVSLAKTNSLKNISGAIYAIPDSLSLFPFFKSNEVTIQTFKDTCVTIIFYTDRGLLDHYSGFIYTNDPMDTKMFDDNVKDGGNDFKIQPNWYLIHD